MHRPTPQVAIVTGALGGIGRATVRRLLQDGWAVAASYAQGVESPDKAMAFKDELGEHGNLISLHPLNLAHSTSIRAFFADALAAWGRLDALVNNAAVGGLSLEFLGNDGGGPSCHYLVCGEQCSSVGRAEYLQD